MGRYIAFNTWDMYAADELARIMMLDCPGGWSTETYGNYVSLFLSVFYQICRDLRELRHMVSGLHSEYHRVTVSKWLD